MMRRSFASTDAVPVDDGFAHQYEKAMGPLSVGARATRAFGDDDGAPRKISYTTNFVALPTRGAFLFSIVGGSFVVGRVCASWRYD